MGKKPRPSPTLKQVLATDYHLNNSAFSPAAVQVVTQLQHAGYQAYIVGGGVRDLLLDKNPKDFDVATNAKPEQIKPLFRRCFLIGRRFRLAHVHIKNEVVEVATFRAEHTKGSKKHGQTRDGIIIRDNIYGTLQEDALRRDFTINALYYDPLANTILDYTGGLADLEHKQLRLIGDAEQRYREDPVRMLRAIRFANKLDLTIEAKTAAPLVKSIPLLQHIPTARLAEEMPKLFFSGPAWQCFQTLIRYQLFDKLFPVTSQCLNSNEKFHQFIKLSLKNSEQRLKAAKTTNFSFLLAAFLWQPLQDKINDYQKNNLPFVLAFDKACRQVLQEQSKQVLITRKQGEIIREIWQLQSLLEQRRPRYVHSTLAQPGFRAAYDFLVLREQAGVSLANVTQWWTEFIDADQARQELMINQLKKK